MGLDMYLEGRKSNHYGQEPVKDSEGFNISSVNVEIGYWRKHPNLHGYIVREFADGVDECQEIMLDEDNVKQIMAAIKSKELPETTGFFFGVSHNDEAQIENDLAIWNDALRFLSGRAPKEWRHIIYRASW